MSVLFIKINNFMCNNSFFSFMNEQKELLLQNGQFNKGGETMRVKVWSV